MAIRIGGAGVLLLLGSSGFFWVPLAFFCVLLGSSGVLLGSSVLSNARRTPEGTPEEPRRTQKEKNTSPPLYIFGAAADGILLLNF